MWAVLWAMFIVALLAAAANLGVFDHSPII